MIICQNVELSLKTSSTPLLQECSTQHTDIWMGVSCCSRRSPDRFKSPAMMHCTFHISIRGNALSESILTVTNNNTANGGMKNQFASFFEASSKFSTRSVRQKIKRHQCFVQGAQTHTVSEETLVFNKSIRK